MNISSILNGISIGKDSSGNFKPSIEGLAVRTTADGKFFCLTKEHKLLDVSDLTFDNADPFVYRIPVSKEGLKPGDLIITSENPFNVLFVKTVHQSGEIKGIDPATSRIVEYTPSGNLFINQSIYVRVISLIDGFGRGGDAEGVLPLLLLANKGDNSTSNDAVSTFFIIEALGGKTADKKLLPLLLLAGAKSESLQTIMLMRAFGEASPLGNLFGPPSEK